MALHPTSHPHAPWHYGDAIRWVIALLVIVVVITDGLLLWERAAMALAPAAAPAAQAIEVVPAPRDQWWAETQPAGPANRDQWWRDR